jgi:hypothetical protein
MRSRPARAARLAAAAVLAAVSACAAPGAAPDDRVGTVDGSPAPAESPALADERFPADFSMDVTVLLGRKAPPMLAVQDRQSKYIVLPDGSLHADLSPFIDVSIRPGRSRWLYDDQMQYLYALCGDLGFGDESRANGPANPDTLRPAVTERLAILTIRAGGRTWSYVRRALGEEPMDAAMARMVRTLAILAWLPDLRPDEVLPERYDFGPDPYAVYREIRARSPRGARP